MVCSKMLSQIAFHKQRNIPNICLQLNTALYNPNWHKIINKTETDLILMPQTEKKCKS